jgi:hypothetical protein
MTSNSLLMAAQAAWSAAAHRAQAGEGVLSAMRGMASEHGVGQRLLEALSAEAPAYFR